MYELDPSRFVARFSHHAQANNIKASIDYLVREGCKKLNYKDNLIDEMLLRLSELNELSRAVHYCHHQLQSFMHLQDPFNAEVFLNKLNAEIRKEPPKKNMIFIDSIGNEEWDKFIIDKAKKMTTEDVPEIYPIDGQELLVAKDQCRSSLKMIARYDPHMFDELKEHVQIIKLFQGNIALGFTDMQILGVLFIELPRLNVNPLLYFLERIVYEGSYMHLYCLMAIDPLLCNTTQDKRFVSPLRDGPRSMMEVFHTTYACARVARTFMRLYQLSKKAILLQYLAETLDEVIRGITEIKKHAELTIPGHQLVKSIMEFLTFAYTLPDWKDYDFFAVKPHRLGVGITKVSEIRKLVKHEANIF